MKGTYSKIYEDLFDVHFRGNRHCRQPRTIVPCITVHTAVYSLMKALIIDTANC